MAEFLHNDIRMMMMQLDLTDKDAKRRRSETRDSDDVQYGLD